MILARYFYIVLRTVSRTKLISFSIEKYGKIKMILEQLIEHPSISLYEQNHTLFF